MSLDHFSQQTSPDLKTFNFLLRRTDAKAHLSPFLHRLFVVKTDFSTLLLIFQRIVENYKQSLSEKRTSQLKTKILFSPKNLLNGEHFLDENEIVGLVCKDFETATLLDKSVFQEYYVSFLTVFFLELSSNDCPLDAVSMHLIQWLLRLRRSNQLQLFYQNGFLQDSLLLAVVFCELGSHKRIFHTLNLPMLEKYDSVLAEIAEFGKKECLQIGVEFLKKIKGLIPKKDSDRILTSYLIENHKIAEAIYLIQNKEVDLENVDFKRLLVNSKSKNSNHSFYNCLSFLNTETGFRVHSFVSNAELERIIKM